MKLEEPRYVLKLSCVDTIGIVTTISGFLTQNGCKIITSSQFGDRATGRLFMRVSFTPVDAKTNLKVLARRFTLITVDGGDQAAGIVTV